ncbi:hypothetical protein ACFL6U_18885 [Planctomycetota bacterium]
MNGIINKLRALIITMSAIAISGCASPQNITREYFGEDSLHLTKSEAASILVGERITRSTLLTTTHYNIVSVNEKQLIFESTLYSDKLKSLYPRGKVVFENVRKIELTVDSMGGNIKLHFEKRCPVFMITCGNTKHRYNKLLLAVLVLCPNVK